LLYGNGSSALNVLSSTANQIVWFDSLGVTDANPVPPRETFTGELKENVFPTRESPVPAR
jgi:hypothetical protein